MTRRPVLYRPDSLSLCYRHFKSADEARAERLVHEVIAMSRAHTPHLDHAPRVVVDPREGMNAADLPFNDTMVVGTALLHELTDAQARAVIGHEVGHAAEAGRVRTLRTVRAASALVICATLIAGVPAVALGAPLVIALPVAAAVWYGARTIPKAVARRVETRADIYSAEVTGRPEDLAGALRVILPDEAARPTSFLRRVAVAAQTLESDHPATYRRIEMLERMQRKMDAVGIAA
jgi:Zn-dependent protease with chaperone function